VNRSKLLPSGGNLDDAEVAALARKVRRALEAARKVGTLGRTPEADQLWAALYGQMAEEDPGGLVGAVSDRDAAQVLRLSVDYALTEGTSRIDVPHLEAARAVWRYCRATSSATGGDPVADRLLDAARQAGAGGLTADQQYGALPGATVIPAISSVLSLLALKLVGVRRVSHVEDLPADPAAGLWAGLVALPK